MSTTTTLEPKKESLGITAALILSLVGLTLLLVIAILIKREIRRGNVKSKRDGHFWSCKFFRKYTQSKLPTDGKISAKVRPQWLLVGHHELPERFYTKDECPQYIARMFTIDLYTVLQHTCRETFSDIDTNSAFESYLINNYPALNDTIHSFRRLKIRAEVDLVPFTIDETKNGIRLFNQLLQKLSEYVNNPYLRQRQITLPFAIQNEEQEIKMSSKYIPLLPKDLCQIPLRPNDNDSLGNMNKRSRSKGRFPFHLPSFLNKRRFFSTKSSSGSAQASKTRNESLVNNESSVEDSDHNNPSVDNTTTKTSRQRFKRPTATDVVPLVEFHDALSQSATFSSDMEPHS
ncbi:unnamed protein product [Rotaria socialis]|uniref:Uncharacterized protein n=1 Tax=Rotaria socialis TaxID=392032 RepID=A0A817QAC8_9BILA|nr:unnamed protein product [Rotaria socialis]CAF3194500.1 unnamed protein product [Rotaria socialis]CAF4378392.1 unnamed protein product [Rotaria socialis]CAF4532501.1 unnamed protein product [Rotaria socialis]